MPIASALVTVTARLSQVGSEDGYGKGDRVLRSGPLQTQGEMDPCRVTREGNRIPGADQKIGIKSRGIGLQKQEARCSSSSTGLLCVRVSKSQRMPAGSFSSFLRLDVRG